MGALEDAQRERRMRERDRQIEAEIKKKEAYVPPVQRVKRAATVAVSAGKKLYATAKPAVIKVVGAAEKATRPAPRRRSPRKAPLRRAPTRRPAPRKKKAHRKPRKDPWDLGIRI